MCVELTDASRRGAQRRGNVGACFMHKKYGLFSLWLYGKQNALLAFLTPKKRLMYRQNCFDQHAGLGR